jgi:hypothetical protein
MDWGFVPGQRGSPDKKEANGLYVLLREQATGLFTAFLRQKRSDAGSPPARGGAWRVRIPVVLLRVQEWTNTRKGYWRISNRQILKTTLTNERLGNLGFENFSKRYEALRSSY